MWIKKLNLPKVVDEKLRCINWYIYYYTAIAGRSNVEQQMKKNLENRQKDVDQYLDSLPMDKRKAPGNLRKIIQDTAPYAEEGFS